MSKYRAAIVGLTGIAASPPPAAPDPLLGTIMPHSHAAAYASVPETDIVAVCDLVPALLDGFQQKWGETFQEATAYTDYRAMLAEQEIDLLSIVTSDHRHAQIVVDGVEAGVNGIFCEKPIATTFADADRMIEACRARNVPLLINHTRRWYPEFVEARRLLRSGAIGPLQRVVATMRGERAMLFRNGTHLIDAVCFFTESDPAWLVAELDDEHRDYGPRYDGGGGRDPARDPGASAYVHFENGVRAFINCSKSTGLPKNIEIDLFGADGHIRIGEDLSEWKHNLPDRRQVVARLPVPATTLGDTSAAVRELIGLIERGGTPSSSGEDGRRTLSILLGIVQSSADGSARVDFPIVDR